MNRYKVTRVKTIISDTVRSTLKRVDAQDRLSATPRNHQRHSAMNRCKPTCAKTIITTLCVEALRTQTCKIVQNEYQHNRATNRCKLGARQCCTWQPNLPRYVSCSATNQDSSMREIPKLERASLPTVLHLSRRLSRHDGGVPMLLFVTSFTTIRHLQRYKSRQSHARKLETRARLSSNSFPNVAPSVQKW